MADTHHLIFRAEQYTMKKIILIAHITTQTKVTTKVTTGQKEDQEIRNQAGFMIL